MTPLDRIELILREKGISKADFQKRLGIRSQHWTNWRNRGVPAERIFPIASELNVNTDWIKLGKGEKYPNIMQDTNAETAPNLGFCRDIPVVGTAQLGDNGNWYDLEYPAGHGDGFIKFPSIVTIGSIIDVNKFRIARKRHNDSRFRANKEKNR